MIIYIMLYHAVHCDTSTILYCKYIVYITGTAGLMRHGRVLCVCFSDPSQSCVLIERSHMQQRRRTAGSFVTFSEEWPGHNPAVTWRCLLWARELSTACSGRCKRSAPSTATALRKASKPVLPQSAPGLMEGVWEVAQPEAQCEAVGQVNLIGVAVPRRVGLDLVWVAAGNRPAHFRHKRVCKSTCWSSTLRGLAGLGAHLSLSIFSFSASSSLHCSSPSRSRCATHHAAVNIVWPYGTARGAAKG